MERNHEMLGFLGIPSWKAWISMFGSFFWMRKFLGQRSPSTIRGFHYSPSYEEFHCVVFDWTMKYLKIIHRSTFGLTMNSSRLKREEVFWMKSVPSQGMGEFLSPGEMVKTTFFLINKKIIDQNSCFFTFFFFDFSIILFLIGWKVKSLATWRG